MAGSLTAPDIAAAGLSPTTPSRLYTLIIIEMEMRDPASENFTPDELTPQPETVHGQDPEAVAEEIVTESIDRDAVIAAAKQILEKDASEITPDDVRRLRQQMNAFRKTETADDIDTPADEDAVDEEFKSLLAAIREKKAEYTAKVEAEREAALARKREIIAEIAALADDTDNVNRTFPRYRELQDEFNALGEVPATEETAIWKQFQEAREKYSDNLKINKELRDYDFKKNHESKMLLIVEAESLTAEDDPITAFRRLQELHNKWRRIGPVAKEIREEIWDRFKTASTEINRRYQTFFEERKAREAENEAGKSALCQAVEEIDIESLKSFQAWDSATKTVMEIQEKWRTFGFASRKVNKQLFARFREACDKFFAAKADFFRSSREELARNLEKKTALADRAEALKDSTDWKKATDEFVNLQKEWKTIGAVAKKHSDAVWKRFQKACDDFFDAKKKATSGARKEEQDNLKAKRQIIADLESITAETPREDVIAALKDAQEKWKTIGHVPFRDKDKVYDAFRSRLDAIREMLDLRRSHERMERFKKEVTGNDSARLPRERERLARILETRRQELRTYENNLGFLSASSKKGGSMLRDFERNVERLRSDIAELEEKIRTIDASAN